MLHPQSQAFIDLLIERKVPPTHTLAPADARKFYDPAPLEQLIKEGFVKELYPR